MDTNQVLNKRGASPPLKFTLKEGSIVVKLMKSLRKPLANQKGEISGLLVLLIVLPAFLFVTAMVITFTLFIMRQSKLDDIKDRALQMMQTSGYLTPIIINDMNTKLSALGFPAVTKGGVTYPSFIGSTTVKVLKDDPDPTVHLVIQYPASDLAKIMAFFGATSVGDPGYYYLEGYGRSEVFQ
jgi:hypothetical protein